MINKATSIYDRLIVVARDYIGRRKLVGALSDENKRL
jgi:hypothetical protein